MEITVFDNNRYRNLCRVGLNHIAPSPTKRKRRAIFIKQHPYDEAEHPVTMYLDSFADESQRVMRSALDSIADIFSDGKVPADKLAWHLLRSQHVTALRGRMLRLFEPATTNRYLTALRGVMKAAWRLDLLDRETMEQTVDVAPARGKLWQRRALSFQRRNYPAWLRIQRSAIFFAKTQALGRQIENSWARCSRGLVVGGSGQDNGWERGGEAV